MKLSLACVTLLVVAGLVTPASATIWVAGSIADDHFTYLGTPTKWDPGPNTASFHGFVAPAGPMLPGAASWSVMPIGTLSDAFDPHGATAVLGGGAGTVMVGAGAGTEIATYAAMLAVWDAASGFSSLGIVADTGATFNTFEPGPGNTLFGDIRIGEIAMDGPGSVLAHAFQPGTSVTFGGTPTIGGDAHFDAAEVWADLVLGGPAGSFDYASVVLHELGHALGLGHSADPAAIMFPSIAPGAIKRTLAPDDLAGIRAIYGIPEPSTWLLAVMGLVGIAAAKLRRRK